MIFCAGHNKIDSGEEMVSMTDHVPGARHGDFRDLLMRLSTSPAMMIFLDRPRATRSPSTRTMAASYSSCSLWAIGKTSVQLH